MTSQKLDAGKPRPDLIPWAEIDVTSQDFPIDQTFAGLQLWWTGRPYALELSIPRRQLPYLARVLAFGAAKYAARGWEAGIQFSRLFAAAARHAQAHAAGEYLDAESGLPHESHFWCNVLFLVVLTARGRAADLDDRPEASASTREKLDRMQALVAQLSGASPVSAAGLAGGGGKGAN